jgi:hypothetical protein
MPGALTEATGRGQEALLLKQIRKQADQQAWFFRKVPSVKTKNIGTRASPLLLIDLTKMPPRRQPIPDET